MSRLDREVHLEALRAARVAQHRLNLDIKGDLAAARSAGATWQQIGDALAITKQAAQQRYGHKNHWTAADTAAGRTPSMFSSTEVAPMIGMRPGFRDD